MGEIINTVDELKYYCEQDNPVGALMLSGEWGCGKTYLINNSLKKELIETHILIRISLFGIENVEEAKNEVKQKWLHAFLESNFDLGENEKASKVGKVAKRVTEKFAVCLPTPAKAAVESALSINILDFINVGPQIGEKKVVLIFDDLERSNIPMTDLLGLINDYCENMKISTIVVANEQMLHDDTESKLKYNEIKEKIVQRTIHHTPKYCEIVKSVVEEMHFKSASYKEFLLDNLESIEAIFAGNNIEGISLDTLIKPVERGNSREEIDKKNRQQSELLKKRPHNIRSLKTALQDFYRVYSVLAEQNVKDVSKFLFSFIAYSFSSKAGLLETSRDYDSLFGERNVELLYPGFYNDKYITMSVKRWIKKGEWFYDNLISEIAYIKERDSAKKPEDRARTNHIFDLEEEDIELGFPILLNKAYSGELLLDEYVILLCNYSWARAYNINVPSADWQKIYDGTKRCIYKLISNHAEPTNYMRVIGEESKKDFLDEEWRVYELIKDFREDDGQIYSNNRSDYIYILKNSRKEAFSVLSNKRFDGFDVEMAKVTFDAFKACNNMEKGDFISLFKNIWRTNVNVSNISKEKYDEGLTKLIEMLVQFAEECMDSELSIAVYHANHFIEIVKSILDLLNSNS